MTREETLALLLGICVIILLFSISMASYNKGILDTYYELKTEQHGR